MSNTNKKVLIAVFQGLLLILFPSFSIFAQAKPSWFTAVESTIKQKERRWKIEHVLENGQAGSFTEDIKLRSGPYTAGIHITTYEILANPKETFEGLVLATDNILGKGRKKSVLNFGDEGFIWTLGNRDGYTQAMFRKNRTFVTIFMPGTLTVQKFAKYVLDQIPR